MKPLNGGNIVRMALDEIAVEDRLRQVGDDQVENLILMAEDTGITTPVNVRRIGGRHVLIDGAHRLEAARRMGLADIAALVFECSAAEARAFEASNNLGAARMTPLQTAAFVASWKREYYAMHPERKPGVFKGNQHTGKVVDDTMSLTKSIAAAFAVSERTIHRVFRAGEHLTEDERARLEAAPGRVTMDDLKLLGKIGDAEERAAVVAALADGKTSAAKALRALRAEPGAAVKDPVEEGLKRLLDAWSRASKEARRRFVEQRHDEVQPLVADIWRGRQTASPAQAARDETARRGAAAGEAGA